MKKVNIWILKGLFCTLISIALFVNISLGQSSVNYGLSFSSHNVSKDLRTSLDLSPNEQLNLDGDFTLSFDINFYRDFDTYGYIFRLIGDDKTSFDFLANDFKGRDHDLVFVAGGKESKIFFDLGAYTFSKRSNWLHLDFIFRRDKQLITVSFNGRQITNRFDFESIKKFKIFFGANDYKKFYTNDVAPFSLRNIKIINDKEVIDQWALKEHLRNRTFNLNNTQYTDVKNPNWLIDAHCIWKKRSNFLTSSNAQIAFQKDEDIIHIAGKDSIYSYHIKSRKSQSISYKEGNIIPFLANQMRYDPYRKQLIQYDFEKNRLNRFNFKTASWSINDLKKQKEPSYWHHNSFFSPIDSDLVVFGGYGFFSFKNTLQKYDFKRKTWRVISSPNHIMPRYLSASGFNKDSSKVYIFGGFGNKSGKQQLSPENLYDLNVLDLKTFSFKKIWSMDPNRNNFVVANSLKINEKNNTFLTLCFQRNKSKSHLFLGEFSLRKPQYKVVGDSIPYQFQDNQSFADLYFSEQTQELFAITSHKINKTQAEINIYSIAYPVIPEESIVASPTKKIDPNYKLTFYFVGFLLLGFVIYAVYTRRKTTINNLKLDHDILLNQKAVIYADENTQKINEINILPVQDKFTILLLGGLKVLDKNGINQESNITPMIQHLFLLLLLYTRKKSKGISSDQMKNILWPEKSEENAKNNRGVSIRKLRLFLNSLGNIKITSENNIWKLEFDDHFFCDYFRVMELMSKNSAIKPAEFNELLDLVKAGPLLPDFNFEWLDDFKSNYSNQLIDDLIKISRSLNIKKDYQQLMNISEIIFAIDSINEDALSIKCSLLKSQGRNSLAKNLYNEFSREYKNVMGVKFNRSFNDVNFIN